MAVLTEGRHAGECIVWEADIRFNRDNITVLSGEVLGACAVLGMTMTGGAGVATANAGNTGNGAMGAITVSGRAKEGTYQLLITEPASNAGNFVVEDPDGEIIGQGDVAAAFSAGGLAFTLADGSTDFAAGDGFSIVVTGTEKYAAWDPEATDGTEVVAGVLFAAVDATGADKPGVATVRGPAVVNETELAWFTDATDDEKAAGAAQLKALGIIVR
jgi:hypothetical protein